MFERKDKRKIYRLIDQYLTNKIRAWDFCSEYHACYDIEIDLDQLNGKESFVFSELSMVAGRFSNFEEDHRLHPGVYYTPEELHQKIIETKEALKDSWLTGE